MTLLCVVAHPDDECFAFGGALALAADRGLHTHVVCFTDGQAASARGEARTGAELGRMRRQEFAASCAVLGVTSHEVLDFEDGQLQSADFARSAGLLVQRMRRLRPEIVLTFGADGGLNTHSDHMMVSALTTAAFHWSGRSWRAPELGEPFQPSRLYHLSTDFFLPDRPPPLPEPWTIRLDIRAAKQRKFEAFCRHTSQAPLVERTRSLFEEHGDFEFYTLAASPQAGPAVQAADLFLP